MKKPGLMSIGVAALVGAVFVIVALTQRSAPERLTEIYTPSFAHVPFHAPLAQTVSSLWADLQTPAGHTFLQRFLPGQGGVLWLSLLLMLVVAFDFEHPWNPRNVDLVVMQATGLVMFEIMGFFKVLQEPPYVALMDWVFISVFALNAILIGRALWRIRRPAVEPWRPGLRAKPLMAAALLLLACDTMAALVREPDDAGYFVNLGAQRLRERHRLPYGDPLLTGSAGAAYGPLLYVAHVPFQIALAPAGVNAESPDLPALGKDSTYLLPPQLATKLCAIAFQCLGVWALFTAATRLAGAEVGWALVALYCGSAFVLGVGGETAWIGGMTFVSHIAPAAMTLVAFAWLPMPMWSGVALGLAAGLGFYPAFMAPAWLGYFWDQPRRRLQFAIGFTLTCLAIGIMVLALSQPAGDRGLVGTILSDTFGHHTDLKHYGFSPFGFWGQRKGVRGWLNAPLVAGSGFTTPFFLVFITLAMAMFAMVRRRAPEQLALAAAAVALGASLLKIQPTGTYVAWAFPLLLLGFFTGNGVKGEVHENS